MPDNKSQDGICGKSRHGKTRGSMRLARSAFWIVGALVVMSVVLMAPILLTKADREAIVHIPEKATPGMVGDTLRKYFGETYSQIVMRLIEVRTTDLGKRHGAYRIRKGDPPFNAMRRLTSGAQEPVRITINGFRSYSDLTDRIAAKMDFNAQDLRSALADTSLLSRYGLKPQQAMSLFLENSYDVYWTATPQELIEKIGHYYMNVWNGRRRAEAEKLGLSPAEVMTLASIVDEETNKADEKGRIARLYVNRLKKGMRLQSDPTVRFALDNFSIKRVTSTHIEAQSPYNTYKNHGLPPGPIRTTSTASIDAVLSAPETEDLYMCAKEDFSGYHNFSESYDEHLENARRYHEELDRRHIY